MSSHVHMIVARHGEQNLEAVIRDIKKYTSVKLIQAIRDNEQESRRELFLWLFEREGKSNPNNTHYQFPATRIDQGLQDGASLIENLKIELRMGLYKRKINDIRLSSRGYA
jgi:hypothetical protein